eukprot:364858-Chlamydomonas_euryale.AAC.2
MRELALQYACVNVCVNISVAARHRAPAPASALNRCRPSQLLPRLTTRPRPRCLPRPPTPPPASP